MKRKYRKHLQMEVKEWLIENQQNLAYDWNIVIRVKHNENDEVINGSIVWEKDGYNEVYFDLVEETKTHYLGYLLTEGRQPWKIGIAKTLTRNVREVRI